MTEANVQDAEQDLASRLRIVEERLGRLGSPNAPPPAATGIREILSDPAGFVQIVLVLLLVVTICSATFMWWGLADEIFGLRLRTHMEVPLLASGVLAILLIVSRTNTSLTLAMAVLIIGTVVAGERFIIGLAGLFTDKAEEATSILAGLPNPRGSETLQQTTRVVAEATEGASRETRESIVTKLSEEVSSAGRDFLFAVLQEDGLVFTEDEAWPGLLDEIDSLRARGLLAVRTNGNRYDVFITDAGVQFTTMSFFTLDVSSELPEDRSGFVSLSENSPIADTFDTAPAVWYELNLDGAASVILETTLISEPVPDTTITVYTPDGIAIDSNDDFDETLFSRLELPLTAGQYYVRVLSLTRRRNDSFGLSVTYEETVPDSE